MRYNAGPYAANLMLKLTPLGANALHDIIGCGIPTVVDYDSTHKDATRYRLHVDAVYEDLDGTGGGNHVPLGPAACGGHQPVSVSGTRAGTADQFIEIQNVSSVPVQMTEASPCGTQTAT
jgi:hypothetical protein